MKTCPLSSRILGKWPLLVEMEKLGSSCFGSQLSHDVRTRVSDLFFLPLAAVADLPSEIICTFIKRRVA